MSKEVEEVLARLGWLHFWARHCCAQADAKLAEVNRLIGQLAGAGPLQEAVFLGEVIHPRYCPPAAHEQGPVQVAQAALCVPGGIGVVLWGAGEYARLCASPEGLRREAQAGFRPFEMCEPSLRALLLPHVEALLRGLRRRLS
jgi:hypothetical protein